MMLRTVRSISIGLQRAICMRMPVPVCVSTSRPNTISHERRTPTDLINLRTQCKRPSKCQLRVEFQETGPVHNLRMICAAQTFEQTQLFSRMGCDLHVRTDRSDANRSKRLRIGALCNICSIWIHLPGQLYTVCLPQTNWYTVCLPPTNWLQRLMSSTP